MRLRPRGVLLAAATALSSKAAAHASISSNSVTVRAQSDPSPDNFVRRNQARGQHLPVAGNDRSKVLTDYTAIVGGKHLYIVGGSVAQRDGSDSVEAFVGMYFPSSRTRMYPANSTFAVNETLSLPIDKDWKASDISYETFPSAEGISHGVWSPSLWANDETEGEEDVYLWGGSYFRGNEPGHPRDRRLWTLQQKSNGKGSWAGSDIPKAIKQTNAGAPVSCGGKGYIIGGWASNDTDPSFDDITNSIVGVPGMVSYDFATGDWKNHSIEALAKQGTYADGAAVCVKIPGKTPKLFVLGGAVNTEPQGAFETPSLLDIQFWDPDSEEWYKQETSGPLPTPRKEHCAVGVPGPNNTFDM